MKYTVTVPPTREQGSYKTVIRATRHTRAAEALWDYNSARAHDGLTPIKRMPAGTTYTRIPTYVIQGFYSGQWEDETEETTRAAALETVKTYRANMPQYPHRLIVRYED